MLNNTINAFLMREGIEDSNYHRKYSENDLCEGKGAFVQSRSIIERQSR